ncbi:MAG: CoA-binding protein [Acidimicrobiia bacterium]
MATITITDAASDFLNNKRIAVAGVSRKSGGEHGGNTVYGRLKERGYETFAVNPNATEVEGDPCYPDIASIPGGVDAVVIATTPEVAPSVVQQCIDADIRSVWMHRAFGQGSVSPEATALGRANGVIVIDGGCPLMFGPTADTGHKVMKAMLRFSKAVPKKVS